MLHLERLLPTIDALSAQTADKRLRLQADLAAVLEWIHQAPSPDALLERIRQNSDSLERWTGALPFRAEAVDQSYRADDSPPNGTVLIAVDGSQVYPDRHAAVLYWLLQVGGVVFRYSGEAPTVHSRELLRYEDADLFTDTGLLISSETIGIKRAIFEIEFLTELADQERAVEGGTRIATLLDGPLLWSYTDRDDGSHQGLERYLHSLSALRTMLAVPVGYIDRPGGHPVIDLLTVLHALPDEGMDLPVSPYPGLSDRDLMAVYLAPGERSIWFVRPTATQRRHREAGHEICFSYLNVGDARHSNIARLEVPCWATSDTNAMDSLQSAIVHQSRALNGYPYILARAHEEALITTQDKMALENALQRSLLAQGVVLLPSEKARQKSYLGRRGVSPR